MGLPESGDISREGLTSQKLIHFFRTLFSYKTNLILQRVSAFAEIDFDQLRNSGIDSIILDVDDCVAPHHGEILDVNFQIIERLKKEGWKIVIFSNMKKNDRYQKLEELGIQVCISQYAKPDEKGFQESLKMLESGPEKTVMIGDNYLTDGGSVFAGIPFIRVMPLGSEKSSFARTLQVSFRDFVRRVVEARIK